MAAWHGLYSLIIVRLLPASAVPEQKDRGVDKCCQLSRPRDAAPELHWLLSVTYGNIALPVCALLPVENNQVVLRSWIPRLPVIVNCAVCSLSLMKERKRKKNTNKNNKKKRLEFCLFAETHCRKLHKKKKKKKFGRQWIFFFFH